MSYIIDLAKGCDMRNIKRVVLWELPPLFCALVQRAGRAARDFSTLGEAILIIPQSVITKGTTEMEVETALGEIELEAHTEAENRGEDELVLLENNGIQLMDDGGARLAHESDEEEGEEQSETKKRRSNQTKKNFNSREVKFLSLFVCTTRCRHIVWDDFFGNQAKCKCNINSLSDYLLTVFVVQLTYPETTTFRPLPGMRCCDNCEPRLFEVE
jgi:superfamily II DNA/RNA helicase